MVPQYLHTSMPTKPVNIIEVFVDNLNGDMNNVMLTHLLRLLRCMLYGICVIFPLSENNHHGGRNSDSEKKLYKGNVTWSYEK